MNPPSLLLILAARLLLSGIFALSSITKLADRAGSRRAMVDFGLPESLARFAAPALAITELLVALLLLFAPVAWWGALGSLLLLALFTGAIAFNLLRGRTPECHCFGQLHSAPIGWRTIVRNGLLAVPALYLVVQGATGIPGVTTTFAAITAGATSTTLSLWLWVGAALLLVVIAALLMFGWFMVNLLRQNGRLLLRLEALERAVGITADADEDAPLGIPVGTPAPEFRLPALNGDVVALSTLLNQPTARGKPLLLYFSNPTCAPCAGFLPQIAEWQQQKRFPIAVISTGSPESNQAHAANYAIDNLLIQTDREIAERFGVPATPGALFVDAEGRIASPVALGPDAIRALVQETMSAGVLHLHLAQRAASQRAANQNAANQRALQSIGSGADRSLLAPGSTPPPFRLPDLAGVDHELNDRQGKETLLLFWNPDCGYCQRMLPKLRDWEARTAATGGDSTPQLLLLSAAQANRHPDDALSAPILLDSGFRVGRAYGVEGTPSALLIDARGKVASEVVVGENAILNLLLAGDPLKLSATHPTGNGHN